MTTKGSFGRGGLRPFKPAPFGRFTLLAPLAAGGMGEIYLAKSTFQGGLEKLCVIKKVIPSLAQDEEFIGRFLDEAKLLVKLQHGSIAQVYDTGLEVDEYWIALEFVDGKDVRRIEQRTRELKLEVPLDCAAYVGTKVLEALAYAHRKKDEDGRELNLVHRDVSPQNVLVSYEGEVKVIDFGLAKSKLSAGRTQPSMVLGKFYYMAPEQARNQPVDRRSDIYAVGVLLYELIVGKNPYEDVPPFEVMERVASPDIPPLSVAAPRCPATLAGVVMKALAPNPADRYQTAEEMRGRLTASLYEISPDAGPEKVAAYVRDAFAEEFARERKMIAAFSQARLGDAAIMVPVLDVKTGPGERTESFDMTAGEVVGGSSGDSFTSPGTRRGDPAHTTARFDAVVPPAASPSVLVASELAAPSGAAPRPLTGAAASAPALRPAAAAPLSASGAAPSPASRPAAAPPSPVSGAALTPAARPQAAAWPPPSAAALAPGTRPAAAPPPSGSGTPGPSGSGAPTLTPASGAPGTPLASQATPSLRPGGSPPVLAPGVGGPGSGPLRPAPAPAPARPPAIVAAAAPAEEDPFPPSSPEELPFAEDALSGALAEHEREALAFAEELANQSEDSPTEQFLAPTRLPPLKPGPRATPQAAAPAADPAGAPAGAPARIPIAPVRVVGGAASAPRPPPGARRAGADMPWDPTKSGTHSLQSAAKVGSTGTVRAIPWEERPPPPPATMVQPPPEELPPMLEGEEGVADESAAFSTVRASAGLSSPRMAPLSPPVRRRSPLPLVLLGGALACVLVVGGLWASGILAPEPLPETPQPSAAPPGEPAARADPTRPGAAVPAGTPASSPAAQVQPAAEVTGAAGLEPAVGKPEPPSPDPERAPPVAVEPAAAPGKPGAPVERSGTRRPRDHGATEPKAAGREPKSEPKSEPKDGPSARKKQLQAQHSRLEQDYQQFVRKHGAAKVGSFVNSARDRVASSFRTLVNSPQHHDDLQLQLDDFRNALAERRKQFDRK